MANGLLQLEEFIILLDRWGIRDVLLPFLLIFTVFFAIFQKSKILGEDQKNMNLGISVIIALMTVVPHVVGWYANPNWDPIEIINRSIPTVSVVVIAIVMLLVLIGLFGGEVHLFGKSLAGWITVLSVLIILVIFGDAANWWTLDWLYNIFGQDVLSVIIILLVFGLLVGFIAGGGDKDKDEGPGFNERMGKMFDKSH
ncbi:MAG: hypothetical protein GXP63_05895 [DPANN group archaeon]|nr:hypothetical protein [DPANN group archaeon]